MQNITLLTSELTDIQSLLATLASHDLIEKEDALVTFDDREEDAILDYDEANRLLAVLRSAQMLELPENLAQDSVFLGRLNEAVNGLEGSLWEGGLGDGAGVLGSYVPKILVLRRTSGVLVVGRRDFNSEPFPDEIPDTVAEDTISGWEEMQRLAAEN